VASVSHIVSGLTAWCSTVRPQPPSTPAKASASPGASSPRGSGRARVRVMRASSCCSSRQFIAAAAPATQAMPTVAANTVSASGRPMGTARNMPITAQNTIRVFTRGLVRA